MKRSELFFNVLLVPVDAAAIVLGFLSAYWLRTTSDVIYLIPIQAYVTFVLSVLPLILIVFALEGLYTVHSGRRGVDEIAGIVVGTSLGVLLVIAAIFLSNTEIGSRIVLLYAYLLSLMLVLVGRWVLRSIQRFLYRFNVGVHRVILLGRTEQTTHVRNEIVSNAQLGYIYLGQIDSSPTLHSTVGPFDRRLGDINHLEEVLDQYRPDELIVTTTDLSDQQLLDLLALVKRRRIDLKLTSSLLGVQTARIQYLSMAGLPMFEVLRTPLVGWGKVAKRAMDVVGSVLALVIFSPLLLAVALAVGLTSPGPIIYRNRRVGQEGVEFDTLKFRTMRQEFCTGVAYGGSDALDYEQQLIALQNSRTGAVYKVANDPRLTPLGDFLRRSSLDEFPQFFNVLLGTMSLVGPRPHQPREVVKYAPWQRQLFTIKPGVTGLAQISGRSELDFDEEARLDISYIEHWTFWTDLRILLRTPLALIRSRTRKAA
ncbi:sugar transferase [Candidatus Berkelbacteria bacterium]|nr:sugar transferase [Candidatus Berkelbacteria bacterium]